MAKEEFIADPASLRLKCQFQRFGPVPLSPDYRDKLIRQNSSDSRVCSQIFQAHARNPFGIHQLWYRQSGAGLLAKPRRSPEEP
jgi:hypothetical protein